MLRKNPTIPTPEAVKYLQLYRKKILRKPNHKRGALKRKGFPLIFGLRRTMHCLWDFLAQKERGPGILRRLCKVQWSQFCTQWFPHVLLGGFDCTESNFRFTVSWIRRQKSATVNCHCTSMEQSQGGLTRINTVQQMKSLLITPWDLYKTENTSLSCSVSQKHGENVAAYLIYVKCFLCNSTSLQHFLSSVKLSHGFPSSLPVPLQLSRQRLRRQNRFQHCERGNKLLF